MALFIEKQNQQLLYEMIHKTPNFYSVFPQDSSADAKNAWFRGVIEHFYQQASPNMTREELKTLNRSVLGYMVSQLQQIQQNHKLPANTYPNTPNTQFNPLNQSGGLEPLLSSSSMRKDIKREHAPEYESREAQYRSLFDTPKPKSIDFSEKLEDEAITNMAELIENHKKMREQELQQYAPLHSMNVLQDVSREELQPTVIPDKVVTFDVLSKAETYHPNIVKEIENINAKIDAMDSKISAILEFIQQKNTTDTHSVDRIKKQMEIM